MKFIFFSRIGVILILALFFNQNNITAQELVWEKINTPKEFAMSANDTLILDCQFLVETNDSYFSLMTQPGGNGYAISKVNKNGNGQWAKLFRKHAKSLSDSAFSVKSMRLINGKLIVVGVEGFMAFSIAGYLSGTSVDLDGNLQWKRVYDSTLSAIDLYVLSPTLSSTLQNNEICVLSVSDSLYASKYHACDLFAKLDGYGKPTQVSKYCSEISERRTAHCAAVSKDGTYYLIGNDASDFFSRSSQTMYVVKSDAQGNKITEYRYFRQDAETPVNAQWRNGNLAILVNFTDDKGSGYRELLISPDGTFVQEKDIFELSTAFKRSAVYCQDGGWAILCSHRVGTKLYPLFVKANNQAEESWRYEWANSEDSLTLGTVSESQDGTFLVGGRYFDVNYNLYLARLKQNTSGVQEETTEANSFSISPNPVLDRFTVNSSFSVARCVVTDMLGKECLTVSLSGEKEFILDASALASGLYFCQVEIPGRYFTKPFVVLHP